MPGKQPEGKLPFGNFVWYGPTSIYNVYFRADEDSVIFLHERKTVRAILASINEGQILNANDVQQNYLQMSIQHDHRHGVLDPSDPSVLGNRRLPVPRCQFICGDNRLQCDQGGICLQIGTTSGPAFRDRCTAHLGQEGALPLHPPAAPQPQAAGAPQPQADAPQPQAAGAPQPQADAPQPQAAAPQPQAAVARPRAAAANSMAAMMNKLNEMQAGITGMGNTITAMGNVMTAMGNNINGLQTQVTGLQTQFTGMQAQINELSGLVRTSLGLHGHGQQLGAGAPLAPGGQGTGSVQAGGAAVPPRGALAANSAGAGAEVGANATDSTFDLPPLRNGTLPQLDVRQRP